MAQRMGRAILEEELDQAVGAGGDDVAGAKRRLTIEPLDLLNAALDERSALSRGDAGQDTARDSGGGSCRQRGADGGQQDQRKRSRFHRTDPLLSSFLTRFISG